MTKESANLSVRSNILAENVREFLEKLAKMGVNCVCDMDIGFLEDLSLVDVISTCIPWPKFQIFINRDNMHWDKLNLLWLLIFDKFNPSITFDSTVRRVGQSQLFIFV